MRALLSRTTRVVLIPLVFLVLVGIAAAAGLPRFYSAQPKAAIAKYERQLDRTGPFTDANCFLFSGNRSSGWRHVGCVGNYNYAGTTYRFRLVATPRSCSRVTAVVRIIGVGSRTLKGPWHHKIFSCKQ
jgi:hypothetical protein